MHSVEKPQRLKINPTVANIPEALSIYMNQMVYAEKRKGIDIVTMSLGEAFFDIPPFSFDNIDFVKGYHYSDSLGLPELREKISSYYHCRYAAYSVTEKNIMISSGSKANIYMVMRLVLEPGDEVLMHEPAWLSYQEQARLAGGIPRFIPYNEGLGNISAYLTDQTKLLVLNNPNNPAGWIYKKDELKYIYTVCREKGIFLLMDEAYSDFVENEADFTSLASIGEDLEGIFVVNSLSKNMGMSGWRIGYVIAEQQMIMEMLKLNQHIVTCAPTLLQMYLAYYFDDIIAITLPQAKAVVQKRARMLRYIEEIGLSHLPGTATFYIFIDVSHCNVNTLDFCLYLLFKYGVATVPGSAYGKSTNSFIRVGIGAESEERLKRGFDIIKMVLDGNLANEDYVNRRLEANGFYKFGDEVQC